MDRGLVEHFACACWPSQRPQFKLNAILSLFEELIRREDDAVWLIVWFTQRAMTQLPPHILINLDLLGGRNTKLVAVAGACYANVLALKGAECASYATVPTAIVVAPAMNATTYTGCVLELGKEPP